MIIETEILMIGTKEVTVNYIDHKKGVMANVKYDSTLVIPYGYNKGYSLDEAKTKIREQLNINTQSH